ncbi:IS1182 family transposase [Kitasatospora sp. Ki12]
MSLRGVGLGEVPEETARLARAVFPRGCLAMRVRDELGPMVNDADFTGLYSARGRPAVSPARLAVVSLLQFTEGLTDRQAAHAVRSRLDWKYALGLELADTGFDFSVLSDFRARLAGAGAGQRVFDAILEAVRTAGLLRSGGRQRTDSTHVLAVTRDLTRLEFVVETMRAALNAIAPVAGEWLSGLGRHEWFDRYCARPEETRFPTRWAARVARGDQVGTDGMALWEAMTSPGAPLSLRDLPAVEILRQVWVQQFHLVEGEVRWREPKNVPPGLIRLRTPYEPEARTGTKGEVAWSGYKAHLTETCEPNAPHVITNVVTTPAPVSDIAVTEAIHRALAARDLLPDVHLVDSAYLDAGQIELARRDHGIELLGPLRRDTGRQKTAGTGFDNTRFTVDWDNRQVTCPNGQRTGNWRETTSQHGAPVVRAKFAAGKCAPCPTRKDCTSSPNGRYITLRPRAEHELLQRARIEQETAEWARRYRHRAGVEGTIAQAVHALDMRRSRYRGLARTRLQHLFTGAAINLARIDAWLTGRPLAPTRTTSYAALRPTG